MVIERKELLPKSDEYPLMAFIANEGVAPKGDRYDRSALVNDVTNKLYKKTQYGDFIYSSNNLETGSIGINKYGNATISPVYSIFKMGVNSDSDFIGMRFSQRDFISKMLRLRQGVIYGQWKIHESEFLNISIYVPGYVEQQMIGTFLDKLDTLMDLYQQKYDILKKYKSGFINDWFVESREPKKFLYELVTQKTSQLLTSHFRENSGVYPVYDAGGKQYTYIDFYNNDTDSIAIIKYGSGCGRTFVTHGLHSVLGTMSELVPNDQLMLKYIYAFTLSNEFKRTCHKYTEIGTTPNLYFSDYSYSKMYLPSKKEIKNFMSIFDLFEQLEAIYQCKTDLLNKVKKYLINSMFI